MAKYEYGEDYLESMVNDDGENEDTNDMYDDGGEHLVDDVEIDQTGFDSDSDNDYNQEEEKEENQEEENEENENQENENENDEEDDEEAKIAALLKLDTLMKNKKNKFFMNNKMLNTKTGKFYDQETLVTPYDFYLYKNAETARKIGNWPSRKLFSRNVKPIVYSNFLNTTTKETELNGDVIERSITILSNVIKKFTRESEVSFRIKPEKIIDFSREVINDIMIKKNKIRTLKDFVEILMYYVLVLTFANTIPFAITTKILSSPLFYENLDEETKTKIKEIERIGREIERVLLRIGSSQEPLADKDLLALKRLGVVDQATLFATQAEATSAIKVRVAGLRTQAKIERLLILKSIVYENSPLFKFNQELKTNCLNWLSIEIIEPRNMTGKFKSTINQYKDWEKNKEIPISEQEVVVPYLEEQFNKLFKTMDLEVVVPYPEKQSNKLFKKQTMDLSDSESDSESEVESKMDDLQSELNDLQSELDDLQSEDELKSKIDDSQCDLFIDYDMEKAIQNTRNQEKLKMMMKTEKKKNNFTAIKNRKNKTTVMPQLMTDFKKTYAWYSKYRKFEDLLNKNQDLLRAYMGNDDKFNMFNRHPMSKIDTFVDTNRNLIKTSAVALPEAVQLASLPEPVVDEITLNEVIQLKVKDKYENAIVQEITGDSYVIKRSGGKEQTVRKSDLQQDPSLIIKIAAAKPKGKAKKMGGNKKSESPPVEVGYAGEAGVGGLAPLRLDPLSCDLNCSGTMNPKVLSNGFKSVYKTKNGDYETVEFDNVKQANKFKW